MGIKPTPTPEAQYYIAEYMREGHNEYSKAVLEERIWTSLPPTDRHGVERNRWLNSILKVGINRLQNRSSLRNKRHAEVFWHRVNNDDMPIATALRLYKDALRLHQRTRMELKDAVLEVLKEYDQLPNVVMRKGKPVRQSSVTQLPRTKKKNRGHQNGSRKAWSDLRKAIATLVQGKIPADIDPDTESHVWREVEFDVKVILDELQGKIQRLSAKKKADQKITKTASRRQLVAACHVLAMDPPRPGKPVDLAKAKRQKRLLAKEYHPDARNGDDSLVAQYDAVMDAYRTIEWYADQFNQSA